MGKIQWDSGIKDEGEKVEEEIGEIIKGKNEAAIKILQEFDVRRKVMSEVCVDCCKEPLKEEVKKKRKITREKFVKDYCGKIDSKNINIVTKIALGKKWADCFDYDYDASDWSTYIYCRTVFKDKKTTIYKQSESNYCRVICIDKHWFRGDTMNSWYTTLIEFFRLFGGGEDGYLNNLEINEGPGINHGKWRIRENAPEKNWIEFLCNENYKKILPIYIIKFMEVVYTIGNFIPVSIEPENFNTGRSGSTSDYWDLTLFQIYEYYKYGPEKSKPWLQKHADWLDNFKDGKHDAWDNFVEKNYMQPFVNKIKNVEGAKYGMPYELWDGHFNGSNMPKKEWQFEQFFVNAKIRILERGELIADALVKEQEKESKTQK